MHKLSAKVILSILAVLLIAIGTYILTIDNSPKVSVVPSSLYKQTDYVITGKDGNRISFTAYHTDLNEMVLSMRDDSTLSLKEQVPLIEKLLDRINYDRDIRDFTTLNAGRIAYMFGQDDTVSKRLIAASKPYAPVPFRKQNNFVRDIMNKKMLYPELKVLFDKYDVDIKVAYCEKVLVKKGGIPYDAMIWFRIIKT